VIKELEMALDCDAERVLEMVRVSDGFTTIICAGRRMSTYCPHPVRAAFTGLDLATEETRR
jgi:hypothetical protein